MNRRRSLLAPFAITCAVVLVPAAVGSWAAPAAAATRPTAPGSWEPRLVLVAGDALWAGGTLRSGGGSAQLLVQQDGNVVLHVNGVATWQTATNGESVRLVLAPVFQQA